MNVLVLFIDGPAAGELKTIWMDRYFPGCIRVLRKEKPDWGKEEDIFKTIKSDTYYYNKIVMSISRNHDETFHFMSLKPDLTEEQLLSTLILNFAKLKESKCSLPC